MFGLNEWSSLIPEDKGSTISLNGKWRFKLEQAKSPTGPPEDWCAKYPIDTPATFEPFYTPDYKEDNDWHDFEVPGTWEMEGYSPATYNQPDNASGFFRKWIDIPADWDGREVKINFDGVQNAAEVWLNGQPVNVSEPSWGRANYHESGWTAWQVDLTPAVKFGEKNLLALRVTKNAQSGDLDSGDYFFLGGIYRPATLFSVPKTHMKDLTIRTKLLPGDKAEVKIIVDVANASGVDPKVTAQLEGFDAISSGVNPRGLAELTQIVSNPRLWSAEFPNLYSLKVELKDTDGNLLEHVTRKVGIREVSIKDGVLLVNGVPVKLTGMCRHDLYVPTGTTVGEELWRKDLELMRAANVNSVRTSHYPYGTGFYDLCDEMGFYVLDEIPYCWCRTMDAVMEPAFIQRARETIARDKNHACVIIWGIGNENHPGGANLRSVADLVKAIDDTRPRIVSELRADAFDVEMDDRHYTKHTDIEKAAQDKERRAKWPILYSENPNVWDVRLGADYGCLDLWAHIMKRTWDVVWEHETVPGTYLWEWQDRAVADKCPTKLYEVDPETGIQYLKVKGIVDGLRNPRPDYYHVKMSCTPVWVDNKADFNSKPGSVVLNIKNRYSFTDLSQLDAKWQLVKDGKAVESGTAHLNLAPRTNGKVALELPAAKADALRIDFDHPRGWNVVSFQFALPGAEVETPGMDPALPAGFAFPQLNFVSHITRGDSAKWQRIDRYRGKLVNAKVDAGKSVDADIVLEADPRNTPQNTATAKNRSGVNPPELGVVVGHVHAELANGEFKYSLEWTGEKADIQELGWALDMPAGFDRFSWKREALWSYYPDTHVGRATGTALPDTMDVPITHVTRPDAYDFNSTKYDCDWATLTDAKGKGLRVEFAAGERHHVRGGVGAGKNYQLIVNKQCSPPRDISTNIVADLYMELNPGDKIEGSFRIGSNL